LCDCAEATGIEQLEIAALNADSSMAANGAVRRAVLLRRDRNAFLALDSVMPRLLWLARLESGETHLTAHKAQLRASLPQRSDTQVPH
jgi:hypothetical protein